MDILDMKSEGMVPMECGRGPQSTAAAGHGTSNMPPLGAPATSLLEGVPRTFEPLKVCLDDDSSLEDGNDGDHCMFDDDAFAFGDEDFVALTEALKRHNPAPTVLPRANHSSPPTSPSSPAPVAAFASQPSLLQFQASPPSGADSSLPSTGASSAVSLGTLALSSSLASCDSMASRKAQSRRRVSLRGDVIVVAIPTRDEYPPVVRERMWSSAKELSYNAMRNAIEFAAEGFNWRNAAEDEQMARSPSGERIHPVHFMNLMANEALGCGPGSHQAPSTTGIGMNTMDASPLPS